MGLKIGDHVKGTVSGIDAKGRGTIPSGGKQLLAYFVIPGEEISGTVRARTKGQLRISVDSIDAPSPDRIKPRCPFVGKCGGCPWQMMRYERQAELKRNLVNDAFASQGLPYRVEIVTGSKHQFFHRNRMDYVFGNRGELGLKEPEKWNHVLDLSACFMLSEDAVKVMEAVREHAKAHDIKPWDNVSYTGFLRYLVIREGKNTGERLAMLVTAGDAQPLPFEDELVTKLKPLCTTFIHGINPDRTDVSTAKEMRVLFGNPYLTERIGNIEYRIPPNSFFQTNSEMAEVLATTAIEFASPGANDIVFDLYCGSGFLSLSLAKASKRVVGVEIDAEAIKVAQSNAELNKFGNTEFHAGATEAVLKEILEKEKPDIVVVDPPRSGLHPKALLTLLQSRPKRIVYVSCNPESLARDLKALVTAYKVEALRSIDLFPHTPHIETIAKLELIK